MINWIFLTILAAILESINNIYDRYILKNELRTSEALLSHWGFFAALMFCSPAIFTGNISVHPTVISFGAISALLYMGAMHYYYRSINSNEISRVLPILSIHPVLILILATIFLEESYQPIQYFGITLIIIGIAINVIDEQKHRLIGWRTIACGFLAALAFSIKNVLVKWLVIQQFESLNILFWIGLFILIFNIPFTIKYHKNWRLHGNHAKTDIILAAALSAAVTIIYTTAVTIGPATLVAFLHRVQLLFVFVIASILDIFFPNFLHERFVRAAFFQKLSGILLILMGSYYLL